MGEEILFRYIDNHDDLNEESLVELITIAEEYPYFQAAWMLYLINLKKINHPDFENQLQQVSIRMADRKKLHFIINGKNDDLLQSGKTNPFSQTTNYKLGNLKSSERAEAENDLISNFIASQPSIKINPGKENENSNFDISEKSVTENEEIITETFANILIQQKKFDKAIDCFRKLSLKFPEKSIYFAGRIEETGNLKNN